RPRDRHSTAAAAPTPPARFAGGSLRSASRPPASPAAWRRWHAATRVAHAPSFPSLPSFPSFSVSQYLRREGERRKRAAPPEPGGGVRGRPGDHLVTTAPPTV